MSSSLTPPTCYYPNSTIALNALPCDLTSTISSCCLESQQCNTQFECITADTTEIVAPSCTLESFDSANCGCPIFGEQTACPDGTICCGNDNSTCCDDGLGRYSIIYDYDAVLPTASAAIQSYLANTTPAAAITVAYTIPTEAATTSAVSRGSPSATSTGSVIGGVNGSEGGLSTSTKIAIAVGTVLGVLLIAFGALILLLLARRRRRRKAAEEALGTGAGAVGVGVITGRPDRSEYEMFGDIKHGPEIDSRPVLGAELDDEAGKFELDNGRQQRVEVKELDGGSRRHAKELEASGLRYELE